MQLGREPSLNKISEHISRTFRGANGAAFPVGCVKLKGKLVQTLNFQQIFFGKAPNFSHGRPRPDERRRTSRIQSTPGHLLSPSAPRVRRGGTADQAGRAAFRPADS